MVTRRIVLFAGAYFASRPCLAHNARQALCVGWRLTTSSPRLGCYFAAAVAWAAGARRVAGLVAVVEVALAAVVFAAAGAALAAVARGARVAVVFGAAVVAAFTAAPRVRVGLAVVPAAGLAAAARVRGAVVVAAFGAAAARGALVVVVLAAVVAAAGAFAAAAAARALVGLPVGLGSFTVPAMTSLKYFPGRKAGTVVFFTLTASPVRGFRAVRAARRRFSKTPKPEMETFRPF